jgi:hypothetical protein
MTTMAGISGPSITAFALHLGFIACAKGHSNRLKTRTNAAPLAFSYKARGSFLLFTLSKSRATPIRQSLHP